MPTVLAPADLIVTKCQIILTVPGADADSAGENALVALGEFLSELDKEYANYNDMTLEADYPIARKGEPELFSVICWLKAAIPGNLRMYGMESAFQSWRQIQARAFRRACDLHHATVIHAKSWIGVVKPYDPESEKPVEAAPAAPKKLVAIKTRIRGVAKDIEGAEGGNLLDECLDHGAELKWECKAGVCDSCRVHVISGMEHLPAVNDNERTMLEDLVDKGWRLSCQCTISGPVEIEQPE